MTLKTVLVVLLFTMQSMAAESVYEIGERLFKQSSPMTMNDLPFPANGVKRLNLNATCAINRFPDKTYTGELYLVMVKDPVLPKKVRMMPCTNGGCAKEVWMIEGQDLQSPTGVNYHLKVREYRKDGFSFITFSFETALVNWYCWTQDPL